MTFKSISLNKQNKRKKIPKYTCTLKFDKKSLKLIQLTRIFSLLEVVFQLSDKLKNNDNNPTIYTNLIKLLEITLNCKEAVNSIYVDQDCPILING